jgi:hydroxyacylglutathione hydrolase
MCYFFPFLSVFCMLFFIKDNPIQSYVFPHDSRDYYTLFAGDEMALEQMKVGYDNFCYVIYDPGQKKAGIVDPGYEIKKPLEFLTSKHLTLEYLFLTHYHSDHTAGVKEIKRRFPALKVVASKQDGDQLGIPPDVPVSDGSQVHVGSITVDVLLTPGHTPGGICLIVENNALLTGDTLFIGDCGRTDLPGGDLAQMFATLHEKLMSLPDELVVFPGHDYGDKPFDTLGHQKRTNKTFLAKTLKEFSMIP